MAVKVLLLNLLATDRIPHPSNVALLHSTIESNPTLHDFHVIVVDTDEILDPKYWLDLSGIGGHSIFGSRRYSDNEITNFNKRVQEQITTGGTVFCLCNSKKSYKFTLARDGVAKYLDNYFFCPIDLGVVNDRGDTFYPKTEELKYYTPLIEQIPKQEIDWTCYFSKVPDKARIIATNRAGYPVFLEVPIDAGKLVMLPNFYNKLRVTEIIINQVIPNMIQEEDFTLAPQWLSSQSFPLEQNLRETLSEVEKAKKLLYTKNRALKKAVAFGFEKIGFKVEILPDGTLPDLHLIDEEHSAMVGVNGHENKQASRDDVLQLLGYISETNVKGKGVLVVNHQFKDEPSKRDPNAFFQDAIQLAERNDISLVSSVELLGVVMKVLEGKLDNLALKKIRDNIMGGKGIAALL